MLGFKFSRVQISREGFHEPFQWNFWTSGGVVYEQFMGDFTYRDSASRQVQLFISFMNFRATSLLRLLYFSTYSGIKNSPPYPKHMLQDHYVSTSLVTVI